MPAELLELDPSPPQPAPLDVAPVASEPAVSSHDRFQQLLIDAGLVAGAPKQPDIDPDKARADEVFEEAYAKFLEDNGVGAATPLTDEINEKATAAAVAAVERFRTGDSPADEALVEAEAASGDAADEVPVRPAGWVSPYRNPTQSDAPGPGEYRQSGEHSGRPEGVNFAQWIGVRPKSSEKAPDPEAGVIGSIVTPLAIEAGPRRLAITAGPKRTLGQRLADLAGQPNDYGAQVWVSSPATVGPRTHALAEDFGARLAGSSIPLEVRSDVADVAPTAGDRTHDLALVDGGDAQGDVTVAEPLVHYDHDATFTESPYGPILGEGVLYGRRSSLMGDLFVDVRDEDISAARRQIRYRRAKGLIGGAVRAVRGYVDRTIGQGRRVSAGSSYLPRPVFVARPINYGGRNEGALYRSNSANNSRIV